MNAVDAGPPLELLREGRKVLLCLVPVPTLLPDDLTVTEVRGLLEQLRQLVKRMRLDSRGDARAAFRVMPPW